MSETPTASDVGQKTVYKGRATVVRDPALQSGEGCSRQDKVDENTCSENRRAQRGYQDARKDDSLD